MEDTVCILIHCKNGIYYGKLGHSDGKGPVLSTFMAFTFII